MSACAASTLAGGGPVVSTILASRHSLAVSAMAEAIWASGRDGRAMASAAVISTEAVACRLAMVGPIVTLNSARKEALATSRRNSRSASSHRPGMWPLRLTFSRHGLTFLRPAGDRGCAGR
jgi:hypothetical protein